jgi:hypothetical protein
MLGIVNQAEVRLLDDARSLSLHVAWGLGDEVRLLGLAVSTLSRLEELRSVAIPLLLADA